MKNLKHFSYSFLIVLSFMIFISCQSTTDVVNPHHLIHCSEVKSDGNIVKGDIDNNKDIFVSVKYATESEYSLFGIQNAKCEDKLKLSYGGVTYPISIIYTKVLDKSYSYDIYSNIKIKGLPKSYQISELQPTGLKYLKNTSNFSKNVSKDLMPAEITSFQINGKLFYVLLSEYLEDSKIHDFLDLILLNSQQFIIADEVGNVYASFSKKGFVVYQQNDSDNFDFTPLIGAYSYIFSMIK